MIVNRYLNLEAWDVSPVSAVDCPVVTCVSLSQLGPQQIHTHRYTNLCKYYLIADITRILTKNQVFLNKSKFSFNFNFELRFKFYIHKFFMSENCLSVDKQIIQLLTFSNFGDTFSSSSLLTWKISNYCYTYIKKADLPFI